jgi:two-component system cell cycle response regulator
MANIVIIEDTPANLELMTYLLEAFGHSVQTATDGDDGLELVRRTMPELIICDVHLPKVDGYEVARTLKSDAGLSSIPLLAVTALAMVGDREKGMAAGFDGYLYKPIEPQTFVADIDRYLKADRRGTSPYTESLSNAPTPNESLVRRGKILVVDDSPVNRDLSRNMLEPLGYEVWLTNSVEQAYALACRHRPDLILSDLHMPDEDGFSLFRRLKSHAELASVPFIIFSVSTKGDAERDIAMNLGAIRFIARPIEPLALLDEISRIFAKNQS